MLPAWLAGVHPRTHAPHIAIILHGIIAIVLAISGTFETLAILAGLATAGIYILICASALRLRKLGLATSESTARYAILPLAAALAIISMIAIIAVGAPRDIFGLFLLVILSAAWAIIRRKQRA
jgi:amino acid transporter